MSKNALAVKNEILMVKILVADLGDEDNA